MSSQNNPSSSSSAVSQPHFVREGWVEATQFHDLNEEDVLREVANRVSDVKSRATAEKHTHPLILLDLDSTLYEVGPRNHQILREWKETEGSRPFVSVLEKLSLLDHRIHNGYSMEDTFALVGLDLNDGEVKKACDSAKKFWFDRFFTSEYLKYDHVYLGSPEFAREVHRLGAEIVYLTGRDEPGMGDGTRNRLIQDGFPFNTERTHLILKKAFEIDDLDHKQEAARFIQNHGTLIASFENEPPNLVALYDIFPKAMHVFVDTVCSDRPAPAGRDMYRIKGLSGFAAYAKSLGV